MEKRKIIKDCILYDSQSEWDYNDYLQYCDDMDIEPVEEGSHEWYEFNSEQNQRDWDDFRDNLTCSGTNNQPCMITGSSGLWDGRHEIIPVLCDTIMDAIDKCLGGNYAYEVEIILTDGHIEIHKHHHDGTNCYEIHLLSEKGKREVVRPIYQWEKDYEPKRWWFKNINGYLF